jgi:hypothetical protein
VLRRFLWLVLLFSLPLWLASFGFDATSLTPIRLPFSALQFLAVLAAGVIVTRQRGQAVATWLARGLDVYRVPSTLWLIAVFLVMPAAVALSLLLAIEAGTPIPAATPFAALAAFLMVYGFSAYCEQLGWTAIMTDELLNKHGVLVSGVVTGSVWAAWHLVPYVQTHHSTPWVLWQCLFTVVFRVFMTKLYVLSNRSVFVTVVLHASYDTAFSMLPHYGSSYSPFLMTLVTLAMTLALFATRPGRIRRAGPRIPQG